VGRAASSWQVTLIFLRVGRGVGIGTASRRLAGSVAGLRRAGPSTTLDKSVTDIQLLT
jgi:hypothetical protein